MKDKSGIIRAKREAIMDAYRGLPTMDRTEVDYVAATLDTKVEERNPRVKFNHSMALEVVGAVGMFVCQSAEARRAVQRVG